VRVKKLTFLDRGLSFLYIRLNKALLKWF